LEFSNDIQRLVAEYGTLVYAVIFLWTFFEGETFVIFAGAAAQQGTLNFWILLLTAWTGSFAGDQMWFWLGHALEAAMGDIAHNFLYIMLGVFAFSASILYFVHRRQTRKTAAAAAAAAAAGDPPDKPDKLAAD
jgi:hypothetical protein